MTRTDPPYGVGPPPASPAREAAAAREEPPPPAPGSTPRRARTLLLCLVFGASFAALSLLLRPLVPWPAEYSLRAKLDWFRAHKDELDCLFLGSSRVFRAVD